MDLKITRFESSYMPLTRSVASIDSFSGASKTRLQDLEFRAKHIPRSLSYEVVKHSGRGQYCFIAFANESEQDMPIGFASCAIIKTGQEADWGFVTDLVVCERYRKNKVATRLVLEMMKRFKEPSILAQSGIHQEQLIFLRVAISSGLISCQRVFESCGFELVRGNGEKLYEYSLVIPDSDEE